MLIERNAWTPKCSSLKVSRVPGPIGGGSTWRGMKKVGNVSPSRSCRIWAPPNCLQRTPGPKTADFALRPTSSSKRSVKQGPPRRPRASAAGPEACPCGSSGSAGGGCRGAPRGAERRPIRPFSVHPCPSVVAQHTLCDLVQRAHAEIRLGLEALQEPLCLVLEVAVGLWVLDFHQALGVSHNADCVPLEVG